MSKPQSLLVSQVQFPRVTFETVSVHLSSPEFLEFSVRRIAGLGNLDSSQPRTNNSEPLVEGPYAP